MPWWEEWEDPKFWVNVYIIAEWLVRLVMLAVVPMRRTPDAAKGWLLLIFFWPEVGLLLYLVMGHHKLPKWRVAQFKRFPEIFRHVRDRLRKDPSVLHPEVAAEFKHAVKLAYSLGHLPILGGNCAELLVDYDGSIKRLASDVDDAKHHVHLLYYIFAADATTQPLIDALGRAVARGVECRVMIDHVGSGRMARKLIPILKKLGVKVERMLPVGLLFLRKAGRYDLRNHRKIAVIDGRVGYTGSQNLIGATFKEGITYEELVIRVTGPIVLELQYLFVADWFVETDEVLDEEVYLPAPEITGTMPMQVLPSGPGYDVENVQRLVVSLIHAARERVVITTPYFIPDEPLLQAMQIAILRGVKVTLILSEKEDQFLVSAAQKSYYEELLEAGVHIHLYRKKFLHAKHMCVDNFITVIGTSNMDIRSFKLNAEVMLMVYDEGLAAHLGAELERYHQHCRRLSAVEWSKRNFLHRFAENMARLVSPLL